MRLSSSSIGAIRRPRAIAAQQFASGSRTAAAHPVSLRSSGGMALTGVVHTRIVAATSDTRAIPKNSAAWLRPPRLTVNPSTGTSGPWLPSAASAIPAPAQTSSQAGGRGQAPRGTRPARAHAASTSAEPPSAGQEGSTTGTTATASSIPILVPAQSRRAGEVPGRVRMTVRTRFRRRGALVGAAGPGAARAYGPSTFPPSTVRVASARSSRAAASWVTTTRVIPARRNACRALRTASRPARSSPASGSSSTRRRGWAVRSPARTTRRCSPPLSSWTARWANRSGSRPTAARAASAVAASAPAASRTSSPTVARSRASRGCWMPSSAPSRPLCSGRPSRVTLPRVGTSRPASIHANVDLPAPLGPVTSTVCPAGMSRSTPLSAGCCHGVPASWTSRAFRTSTRAPRTRAIGRHAAAPVVVCSWPSRCRVSVAVSSSGWWEMCTTVAPSSRTRPCRSSTTSDRPRGSSIAVLSSLITTAGRRAMRAATARRWSSPPDSVDVSRSAKPVSPTRASSPSTSMSVPGSVPHSRSSTTRTPRTWLSGRWKITPVPPGAPRPADPGRWTVPSVGA